MRIGIYGHELSGDKLQAFHVVVDALDQRGISWTIGPDVLEGEVFGWAEHLADDYTYLREVDYVLTLGGDGTILKAVRLIGSHQTPIIGFNLGRMGFLASMDMHQLDQVIDALETDNFDISERSMLSLHSDQPLFGDAPFALNDFTLHKRDTSAMITITTYIDGDFLASYWADGLIVSTPTGSTGYSMSCGGPIIMPKSGNLVITPVAPHNLNVRPIILDDEAEISFEISGRSEVVMCSMDSRFEVVNKEVNLRITKCPFSTRLVQLRNYSYLANIRLKLAWGLDHRN